MQTKLHHSGVELRDGILSWRSPLFLRRRIAVGDIHEVKRAQKNRSLLPALLVIGGIGIAVAARLFLAEWLLRLCGQVFGYGVAAFGFHDRTKRFGIWIRHSQGVEWIWSRDNPVQLDSFLYLLDGEVESRGAKTRDGATERR